ncbi:GNAT family N-acetyltransferase [Deinococcus sp. AJ005]|uniref:GNAT family N-acetyltransferase n=1 Tax=Deinococcus sp. AJ005 TaxID=2652443 RepID=UPI00125CC658|nr:GNAT family N-acetyltransferase [Deinococcus sp. AJ005]QFP76960.1 GNAT family N-acetyltransferase [Deinococcus sp. AJ005]
MIRPATSADFERIYEIINDAAQAYRGIIPADRWQEPYMPSEELREQIADGVEFLCFEDGDQVIGVMGIQDRGEVKLIRHAYVATRQRGGGIGSRLLRELLDSTEKPVLIGTWAAAAWAISFYQKHGFSVVSEEEKNRLLRMYWSIPERQVETSVVLADARYREAKAAL